MTAPRKRKRSTYDRALDLLEARARGTDELRRLLVKKGEPPADVDAAVERLQAAGLLDDAAFARQLARSRALGAGSSRRRIRQELAKKGIAGAISETAIDEVFADEGIDERDALERVARKKLRMLAKLDAVTKKRRLFGYLARRGYDSDDIQRTVSVVLGRDHEAE